MGRLHVGMIVRTSYGTGPYRITDVVENCNCPKFLDELEFGDKAPKSKPHYHLVCKRLDNSRDSFHLNGYDENLLSVWGNDRLIDCSEETTLLCVGLMI